MQPVLRIKNLHQYFERGTVNENHVLRGINLSLAPGEFVTIIGGNGAGKSTLLNSVAGTLPIEEGQMFLNEEDITKHSVTRRSKKISRVFQDPKMGTAPRMTVAENLLIAKYRGEKRGLKSRHLHLYTEEFQGLIERISNGLEKHLETPAGLLSGGQRQALSLLMATLKRPELLLLDEHTAALDPKTSVALMKLTDEFVTRDHLTALMITHHMEDALKYGNRLIVMKDGQIIKDLTKEEKDQLDIADYYAMFE